MVNRVQQDSQARVWRTIVGIAVAGLVLAGCSQTESAGEADRDADAAALVAAHESFVRAYESAQVEAVVALLDPSSELLIFHPAVESRFDGVEEVRAGLTRMFAAIGRPEWLEVHTQVVVRDNVGWLTANIVIEAPDAGLTLVGRSTEIWTRSAGGWKLSHAHWSANPQESS